jgi:hypothetical protein
MGNNKQLMGFGLIALSLFLFWPLTYAEYEKISLFKTAIADRDAAIKERSEIQQNISKLKKEYEQRGSELATFSAVVPAKKSTAEILSSLEAIATQTGNVIADVAFSTSPIKGEQYSFLQISIQGRGAYSSLKSMLDSFEKNIPLIDVQTIQMSIDPQTLQLSYQIQALTYFINDSTATK